jgi:oxygen-independent coproporphyrinogen-3 oxidase
MNRSRKPAPIYSEGYAPLHPREYYELYEPASPAIGMGMGMGMSVGNTVKLDSDETESKLNEILNKPARSARRGVYLHTPFCRSRCSYCSFYRYSLGKDVSRFVDATVTMLERLGQTEYVSSQPFEIFYFGGGSPTAIGLDNLERILSTLMRHFKPLEGYEFTVETTISDLSPEMLSLLKQYSVNRISMGVQSFDTDTRRRLGRSSDREQIVKTIEMVRDAGVRTSVDVMYSIPGQTLGDFVAEVRTICELEVDSMSQYRMKLSPITPLQKQIDAGESVPQPSRSEWTDIQLAGWDEAERHGYHRWNTKNFGKTEQEHCHYNFRQYCPVELLPTGCGGGGHIGVMRIGTNRDVDAYCQTIEDGRLPYTGARISNMDTLYLSMLRGIIQQKELDLVELGKRFKVDVVQLHQETFEDMNAKGLLEFDGNMARLTRLGVVWWPQIAADFKVEPGTIQVSYDDLPAEALSKIK